MSEIEINFTLRFNISETDFNVKDLLPGVKDTNSQIMLGISNQLLQKFLLSLENHFILLEENSTITCALRIFFTTY